LNRRKITMPRSSQGPLSDADYEKLNRALQSLDSTHHEVATALAAGLDCAAEDQMCKDYKARLGQIKAAYFPERP
jgi:hypothetical protein